MQAAWQQQSGRSLSNSELNQLSHDLAYHLAGYQERQALLERDTGHSILALSD